MSDADEAALVDPDDGNAKLSRSDRKAERKAKKADRPGLFSRTRLFFRQTVAELRKVIYPTRRELISYTWVVLVFVITMGLFIGLLDFGFAKVVLKVFG